MWHPNLFEIMKNNFACFAIGFTFGFFASKHLQTQKTTLPKEPEWDEGVFVPIIGRTKSYPELMPAIVRPY